MTKFKSEQEIRGHVKLLKNFYGEVTAYLFINAIFIILWVLAGGGYFWPVWPIVTWLVFLIIKASKLGIIEGNIYQQCDAFRNRLPFINSEWAEEKVKELLSHLKAPSASASEPAAEKPVPSKPAAPKVVAKRAPSLKKPSPRKK